MFGLGWISGFFISFLIPSFRTDLGSWDLSSFLLLWCLCFVSSFLCLWCFSDTSWVACLLTYFLIPPFFFFFFLQFARVFRRLDSVLCFLFLDRKKGKEKLQSFFCCRCFLAWFSSAGAVSVDSDTSTYLYTYCLINTSQEHCCTYAVVCFSFQTLSLLPFNLWLECVAPGVTIRGYSGHDNKP